MKSGVNSSEFWVHMGTMGASWTTSALALMGQFKGVVPEKYNSLLVVATMLLGALQAASYSLSRSKLKVAHMGLQATSDQLALAQLRYQSMQQMPPPSMAIKIPEE